MKMKSLSGWAGHSLCALSLAYLAASITALVAFWWLQ